MSSVKTVITLVVYDYDTLVKGYSDGDVLVELGDVEIKISREMALKIYAISQESQQ